MANTHQAFYQNEVRALQLEIDDNDGTDFAPSAAYVTIKDSSGNVVGGIEDQAALTDGNSVSTIIGTLVTANTGSYKVIWKIQGNQNEAGTSSHIYFHVTELEIQPL